MKNICWFGTFVLILCSCASYQVSKQDLIQTYQSCLKPNATFTLVRNADNLQSAFPVRDSSRNDPALIIDANMSLRIGRRDGQNSRIDVLESKIANDTLFGYRSRIFRIKEAIPLDSIRSIELYTELPRYIPRNFSCASLQQDSTKDLAIDSSQFRNAVPKPYKKPEPQRTYVFAQIPLVPGLAYAGGVGGVSVFARMGAIYESKSIWDHEFQLSATTGGGIGDGFEYGSSFRTYELAYFATSMIPFGHTRASIGAGLSYQTPDSYSWDSLGTHPPEYPVLPFVGLKYNTRFYFIKRHVLLDFEWLSLKLGYQFFRFDGFGLAVGLGF